MKRQKGFTFVELLVVVTIISLLAGAGMVSFSRTNVRARDSKRKADIEAIRSALEICRAENGSYPASIGTTVSCGGVDYLNPVPTDPKDGQSGYGYQYSQTSSTTYTVCALLMEADDETSPYCLNNP